MTSLRDAIKKKKNAENPMSNWEVYLSQLVEEEVKTRLRELTKDLPNEMRSVVSDLTAKLVQEIIDTRIAFTQETKRILQMTTHDARMTVAQAQNAIATVTGKATSAFDNAQTEMNAFLKESRKIVTTLQGPPGEPGRDANPDSVAAIVLAQLPEVKELQPYEIARGLETLKENDRLDKTAIKGLEEEMRGLQRAISQKNQGKGGGGMGMPEHEVKTISAGTTSVQTNYPIAAGGNAIFKAAYQGQILDVNVHFTVSSNRKTITFNTDVQAQFINSTAFSITYIRG